jgi:RNA polymerase sigma factor (sigma-70 family)
MPSPRISDAALVHATRARDPEAWRTLVERHDGLIRRVCRAHRLNHADAEDVRQTTWLRAFEHVDRLRNPHAIGGWLAMVARRECLSVLRHSARVCPSDDEMLERTSAAEAAADAPLLAGERRAAVRRALTTLPARDQALIGLLYGDVERSYADIGRTLAMPIGSIGPTRARALDRLRARAPLVGLAAAA